MKKYMLLYMSPVSAEDQMNVSPDEMKKGMEPWMAWFGKCGSAIVDAGAPLGKGFHVSKQGNIESQTHVGGYTIVQAEDMDGLNALLVDHPHLVMPDASIEVLEIMPMPGM